MAVDSTTAFRNVNVSRQSIPLPPGDLLTTPDIAERLQITDAEALKPGHLGPFLASQTVKYNEIVNRPEIKTLAAEIPEYVHDERQPVVTALSYEEHSALTDWRNDVKSMLTVQSDPTSGTPGTGGTTSGGTTGGGTGGGTTEDVSKQIQQYIDDAAKSHPDAFGSGHSKDPVDIISGMMTGELFRETAESKKKYQELLASAKDPESVILALTWHESLKTASMMGQAFEALKAQQDGLDKIQAQMDLKGKTLTQADLLKDNMDFGKFTSGSQEIYQGIMQITSNYSQQYNLSHSMLSDLKQVNQTILTNYKT